MATEKPYILPQGQQLTSEAITNLYLYAQPTILIKRSLGWTNFTLIYFEINQRQLPTKPKIFRYLIDTS